MPDLFKLLVDFSSQRQLPFLVIGGHAVNAYGYSRETADVDILVNKADRDQWLSWFHSLNYTIYREAGIFVQFSSPGPGWWPLDMMFVGEPTFSTMITESKILEDHPGKPRIPSVDHLIALKLHALKNTRLHRFLKDYQDVIGLIECQKLDPHSEKIRRLFEKHATMDLYEKVLRALS